VQTVIKTRLIIHLTRDRSAVVEVTK